MHLRTLALLAVIALTPLRAQIIPKERRLRTGVAGDVPVGIPVDSLYAIVGRERTRVVDLQLEGFFTPAIEILSRAGGPRAMQAHITATACGFLISRVDVFDPTYHTESGLHVGMTLVDVRARHSVELSAEEGAHALVGGLGMAFELSSSSGADSTHVIAIRIDGPAAADLCRRPGSPTRQRALPSTGRTRPGPAASSSAQSVDSATNAQRWIRPAPRR